MTRVLPKNNPHFYILLTEGSILQSLQEGGLTLYKVVHAILSNIRTTTWGLDYYQKTLTMQKPLCSCGWCIYNHHNKSKVMNISCIHSGYHWLKLTYLISVFSISAPRSMISKYHWDSINVRFLTVLVLTTIIFLMSVVKILHLCIYMTSTGL